MCRSESSLSHGASRSTSASNGLAVNGSSSLSSLLHGPTGSANSNLHDSSAYPVAQPLKAKPDEMIAYPHKRQGISESGMLVQRLRSYSPVTRRGLTLREAYMPSVQVSTRTVRPSSAAAATSSTSGIEFTSQQNSYWRMTERHRSPVVLKHKTASPTNKPASPSLLPESVCQSVLKRRSYLSKLVSDADRVSASRHAQKLTSGSDAEASASDVSSIVDKKPTQTVIRRATRPSTAVIQGSDMSACFPPPPSADELQSLHHDKGEHRSVDETSTSVSNSSRLQSNHVLASKVHGSPFLTGAFLSTDESFLICNNYARQPLPRKNFDYKEFQRTGSWVQDHAGTAATRPGSLGSKTDSWAPSLVERQKLPAACGQEMTSGDGLNATRPADKRRTSGNYSSTGLCLSVSGVKPASHHEPCRHT